MSACDAAPSQSHASADATATGQAQADRAEQPAAPAAQTAPPDATPPDDVKRLTMNAKQAYGLGKYREAIDLAEQGLRLAPRDEQLESVAGLAACRLKDQTRAQEHVNRLQGQRARMVRKICEDSGIVLSP